MKESRFSLIFSGKSPTHSPIGGRRVCSFLAILLVSALVAGCQPKEEAEALYNPNPFDDGQSANVDSDGVVDFIPNPDSPSLWDEIHIFYYEDSSNIDTTAKQALFSFTPKEGIEEIEGAQILIVAGGGGGGASSSSHKPGAGGGGAGGVIHGTGWTIPAGSHSVAVGAGGNGTLNGHHANQQEGATANNGKPSSFTLEGGAKIEANGGGAGGSNWTGGQVATSGGSSGGAGGSCAVAVISVAAIPEAFSAFGDFEHYGSVGGLGATVSSIYPPSSGGGGGAGGVGTAAVSYKSGDGGTGLPFSITGIELYYAAGGGGGAYDGAEANVGFGGNEIGGTGGFGSTNEERSGRDGVANTGSGGGGSAWTGTKGGDGGSGIVVVRFPWKAAKN